MADLFPKLRDKTTFSLIDFEASFYHIKVADKDVPKTAILTPFGAFECVAMGFGFKTVPSTMQRYMDDALRGLPNIVNYIDDILVATGPDEDHEAAVRAVFDRLREYHLRINKDKCFLFRKRIQFLGQIVSFNQIEPIPERIDAIRNYPQPMDQRSMRRFHGVVSYYRKYMPHAAEKLAAFSELLKRKSKLVAWTDELTALFYKVREELVQIVVLTLPGRGPMRLITDASGIAIAGALEQLLNEDWRLLGFYSRKLHNPETRYSTFDRELLAVHEALVFLCEEFEAKSVEQVRK